MSEKPKARWQCTFAATDTTANRLDAAFEFCKEQAAGSLYGIELTQAAFIRYLVGLGLEAVEKQRTRKPRRKKGESV